jgi:CRP-like cAMP-binding protein/HEAT repeat protein
MAFLLSRFLNIRRAERPRLAWLYAMIFASILGYIWGEAVIEAGFLSYIGVQYLPLAMICSALVSMGSISIYNAFADRITNHKLLVAILSICVTGIGAGILLLASGWRTAAFFLLYVSDTVMFRDLLNVHWPIYVNGFFDTQSAKRVIPVLSSASRLASIIGGLTMPLMNRILLPAGIITIMLTMQLVMMILAMLMRRTLGESRPAAPLSQARAEPPRAAARIQEGFRYVTGSPFLRWMAVSTLIMMILLAFLNFQTGRILQANLKTVQNISNFTGLLNALGNLIALPIQIFLLSRLIGWAGVGNAALIFPATSFMAMSGLILAPGFITAGFGYLTRTVMRTTFNTPVDSLLYNAVPLRVKARSRGFISGYVMTTGSLVGGLLLGLNKQIPGPLLTAMFGALALVYLGSALQVRRQYGKAVVAMLEQDDYTSFLSPSDTDLPAVDDATLDRLAARLEQQDASQEIKIFSAQIICYTGGARAIPIMEKGLQLAGEGHLRARLIEILAAYGSNQADAEAIYKSYLDDAEKEVRQAALAGLEGSCGDTPLHFQDLVAPLLADQEPEVRAAALTSLVHTGRYDSLPAAHQVLETLLSSEQPRPRSTGVRILGSLLIKLPQPAREAQVDRLLAACSDPDDEVRLAAVLAIEEAAGWSSSLPAWLPRHCLQQLLSDPMSRVRTVAANLLSRSQEPEAQALLVGALADRSPEVRFAAAESLVQSGQAAIARTRPLLEADQPQLRTMSAVILGRIDPAQFGPVILSSCVTNNLQAVYRFWGYLAALADCPPSPALNVLRCALVEQNSQRLDEIFNLLHSIRSPKLIDKAEKSLHSQDPLRRANAVEALEVLTTPQIARLIGPLYEEHPNPRMLLALGKASWNQQPPSLEQAIQELEANREDPWLGECAAAVRSPAAPLQEDTMISNIEKVIFLKEVPFFQGMTVDQLRVLAGVCEEEFFPAESRLFTEGDPGGALYVVVSGRVGIEQEKRKGSFARLATVEAHSYLGETDFFDNNCRTISAIAIQDTLTLRLRREPLIALARQYPELSLELINVLSARLREANNRVAELTKSRPRGLHKLYDQLSEDL